MRPVGRRGGRPTGACGTRVEGRLVPCLPPVKSPWLHPMKPPWIDGKRRLVEPARLLTACEREDRVRDAVAWPRCDHVVIPHEVA
jgi:hypothetical protein